MMEQHKVLTSIWHLIKEALEHENGVTAQKRVVEMFCKRDNDSHYCS
jgi:hypothetical protein